MVKPPMGEVMHLGGEADVALAAGRTTKVICLSLPRVGDGAVARGDVLAELGVERHGYLQHVVLGEVGVEAAVVAVCMLTSRSPLLPPSSPGSISCPSRV